MTIDYKKETANADMRHEVHHQLMPVGARFARRMGSPGFQDNVEYDRTILSNSTGDFHQQARLRCSLTGSQSCAVSTTGANQIAATP